MVDVVSEVTAGAEVLALGVVAGDEIAYVDGLLLACGVVLGEETGWADETGEETAWVLFGDEETIGVVDLVADSVTGQTVVEMAMMEVTTYVVCDSDGQLVTDAAHDVTVTSVVVYTVEVVSLVVGGAEVLA